MASTELERKRKVRNKAGMCTAGIAVAVVMDRNIDVEGFLQVAV